MKYCPHPELRRSKRRLWEWPLTFVLRVRPYRCSLCHQRIWRYRGRLWLDVGIVALLVFALWLWQQGTSVKAEDELAALAQAGPAVPGVESFEPAALPQMGHVEADNDAPDVVHSVAAEEASSAPSQEEQLMLNEVRWLSEARQFRLIIEFDGGQMKAQVYQLESPPRLVLDLPGDWRVSADQLVPQTVQSDLVAQVRLGDHAQELRVVLDMHNADNVTTRIKQDAGRLELKLNLGS